MILNAMEKRLLFQVEGDCLAKVLNELHMVARYTKNPEQREAAESLMAKLRVLTDAEGMGYGCGAGHSEKLPSALSSPDDWGKDCGGQAAVRRGEIKGA